MTISGIREKRIPVTEEKESRLKILAWQSKMTRILEGNFFFLVVYAAFLHGFFLFPSTRWHNNLFYALIVLPYLLTLHKKRIKIAMDSKIWVLSMTFIIYLCLTLLWAEDTGQEGALYYLRRPIYLFVFLTLTVELFRKYPRYVHRLFVSLCWTGALTALISIFLSASRGLFFEKDRLLHVGAQLSNPIEGGGVYGILVLVMCFLLLKKEDLSHKWAYVLMTIIFLAAVVLTKSRGPLGALVISIFAGGFLTKDWKVLCSLVVVVVALIVVLDSSGLGQRIFRLKTHRLELYGKTVERARDSIVFGKGISTDTRFKLENGKQRKHGHSVYFGTLLYGGLFGLVFLLMLIGVSLYQSFTYFLRTRNVTYFALLLFGSICIITGEDKLLTHPDALWLIFWLPLGLLAGEEVKRKTLLSRYSEHAGDSSPSPS